VQQFLGRVSIFPKNRTVIIEGLAIKRSTGEAVLLKLPNANEAKALLLHMVLVLVLLK